MREKSTVGRNFVAKERGFLQVQDRDPLSEQAMADVVSFPTEFYGKTFYEHVKYRLTTAQPEQYLAASISGSFKNTYLDIKSQNANMTTEQRLQDVIASGALTSVAAQKIRDFKTLIDGYYNSNPTFGELYYAIKNFELGIINSPTLNQDDMEPILGLTSMFRNHLKYQYEMNGLTVDDRSEGCFLGRKLSCWLKVFTDSLLDSLKAALTLYVGNILNIPVTDVTWKVIKKAALAAGIIGAVLNIIKIYLTDSCKCGDTATPIDPCARPSALTLTIAGDCDPDDQTVAVVGQGSAAISYTYTIENGVFPTFGNVTFITTPSSSIKVHQNNLSVPIKVGVVVAYSSCFGGSIGPMDFDLPGIINGTGTLAVVGATNISWGDPTVYTYDCIGTWRVNANTILINIGPSYHGTLVSSNLVSANVRWDHAQTAPYSLASVSAQIRNACSLQTTGASLYPIVIQ